VTIEPTIHTYQQVARQIHPHCAVCGRDDAFGLGLKFHASEEGGMIVVLSGSPQLEGYPDRLHGGIIAALFDAAMTHCLFARSLAGVTATLDVRFLQPVAANREVSVHARVEKQKSHLFWLSGTLHQDDQLKARAKAKFWVECVAEKQSK